MIDFDRLPAYEQNKIIDRANLRMVAVIAALVTVLGLLLSPSAGAMYVDPGTSVGASALPEEDEPGWNSTMGNGFAAAGSYDAFVYSKPRWRGYGETVAAAGNVGRCLAASDGALMRVKSVKNRTPYKVTLYAEAGCHGRTTTVAPHRWKADLGFSARYLRFRVA